MKKQIKKKSKLMTIFDIIGYVAGGVLGVWFLGWIFIMGVGGDDFGSGIARLFIIFMGYCIIGGMKDAIKDTIKNAWGKK